MFSRLLRISVLTRAAVVRWNIDHQLGIGIIYGWDVGFLFNATAIIAAGRQAVIGLEIEPLQVAFEFDITLHPLKSEFGAPFVRRPVPDLLRVNKQSGC